MSNQLTKEEYEELAKFNAEIDVSWCDEYEGNAHLTDTKSLRVKGGKKNRPTKEEIKRENEKWEEMEKERLETMPRPARNNSRELPSAILEISRVLEENMTPEQYQEVKVRLEEFTDADPDSWTARPSTSSGNGPLESIEDLTTFLAPYIDQHIIQTLLANISDIHSKQN